MPAGERLGAVVHSFHPPPIRGDPGEAHGEDLRAVRACCVDLDAPVVQLVTSKPSEALGREFKSRKLEFFLTKKVVYIYIYNIYIHIYAQKAESDLIVSTQNSTSRSTRERNG